MKCDNCGVDIPPAWVKVIASNICVECEGPIMSDGTIELMAGLKSALEQMPNDPQGIAGWLLSNYRMQKVGTGEPTGFIGVKSKSPNQSNNPDLKIAENPLQKFLKRAGIKPGDQEKSKAQLAEIMSGISDDPEDREVTENDVPEVDDVEFTKQALKTMIAPNVSRQQMKNANANSNLLDNGDEEDLSGLHPALHEGRLKRLEAQRDLSFGGVGVIKRG